MYKHLMRFGLPYLIAGFLMFYASFLSAAPKKSLWHVWEPYQADSTQVISQQDWQVFLSKYVYSSGNGVNLVRYAAVTPKDHATLNQYLENMSHLPIGQYNRHEQLAYWINLYNALTVALVLKHYPVKSIRNIKLGGFFSQGPWDEKLIVVDGIPISLNDIEHRIIRPIWNDPRTHYALNCASYSCPNLQKNAYTGANVEAQLTQDAKEYINSPRGITIKDNKLVVSSIYSWYKTDFGADDEAVIAHLIWYAQPALADELKQFHKITAYQYNWYLNVAPVGGSTSINKP